MGSHNSSVSALIRKYYGAYESEDRNAIEDLLSDDFVFSSPLDDRINRTKYFERCWPNSQSIRAFRIEKIFAEGNEAFVLYEGERYDGRKWRCTEFFRVEGNKVKEVQVFFASLPNSVLKP